MMKPATWFLILVGGSAALLQAISPGGCPPGICRIETFEAGALFDEYPPPRGHGVEGQEEDIPVEVDPFTRSGR